MNGGGGVLSAAYLAAEVFINVTFLFRLPLLVFPNEAAQKGTRVLQSFHFQGALAGDSGLSLQTLQRQDPQCTLLMDLHALTRACIACCYKGRASTLANAVNNSGERVRKDLVNESIC